MIIRHPQIGEITSEDLASFICEGKRNGWASGREPDRYLPDGESWDHKNGHLVYSQTFRGSGGVIEDELVSFVDKRLVIPLWGMNGSQGFRIPNSIPEDKDERIGFTNSIYNFLKANLLKVSVTSPFRGPLTPDSTKTSFGELAYINSLIALETFQVKGIDVVLTSGQTVFENNYHGRLLLPNENIFA